MEYDPTNVIDLTVFDDMDDLEWQRPAMLTLDDLATDDESTINTSMEVDERDSDDETFASTDEDLQNMEAGWNVEIIQQPTNLVYEFDEEADEFLPPPPQLRRMPFDYETILLTNNTTQEDPIHVQYADFVI